MLETKAQFTRRMGWKNRSTATRYADDGKIVVTADGLVDVEASQALLAAASDPDKEGVRQRHARNRQSAGAGDATKASQNDSTYQLLTKHRAAAEYNRAELLRLELEEKEERLVDSEVVRRRAMQLARKAREAIMNLRHRIDPELMAETDSAKRAVIWDRELRAACEDLARGVAEPLAAADGGG